MSLRFRHLIPLVAAACVGESGLESVALLDTPAAEATAPVEPPTDVIAGELVVKLTQPLTLGVAVELGGHRVVPVMEIVEGTWLVRLDVGGARAGASLLADTLTAIADVAQTPGVEYAHPNHRLEWSATPNDPQVFDQLWHYDQIRVRQAWDVVKGPNNAGDVTIAVLDSGRTAHPDLGWEPGVTFSTNPPAADATNPETYHHGVMVAGLIGARTNNGLGIAGICWNCTIIPVRINDAVGPSTAAAAAALRWVSGLRDLASAAPTNEAIRAQIANLSFNSPFSSVTCAENPTMQSAIIDAVYRGVTVIVSAGNQGFSSGPTFPANCPGVIAVAASNQHNVLAGYSNRGIGVDVVAPGGGFGVRNNGAGFGVDAPANGCPRIDADLYDGTGGIVSTWSIARSGFDLLPGEHCYRQGAGTSFAAPHVAGVVALLRARRPGLSPEQLRTVLRLTARTTGSGFFCGVHDGMMQIASPNACGAGRLDARSAVDAVAPGSTTALAAVSRVGVDFGTVIGAASQSITLTNRGFGDSLISTGPTTLVGSSWFRFTSGCSGQSCNQSYSLTTGAARTTFIECAPTGTGVQTAELVYSHSGVGTARVQLSCTGMVEGQLVVTPSPLAFGNVRVGTSATVNLTLANPGTGPVSITGHSLTGGVFSLGAALPSTIVAGGSAIVPVRCAPIATVPYAGTLTISSSLGDRPVPLSCAGVLPGIEVSPSAIDFGVVELGGQATQVVTIQSTGGAPLTVFGITASGGAFSIANQSLVLAPAQTATITPRCSPTSTDLVTGWIEVQSDAGTRRVDLSCRGGRAQIVAPTWIDMPDVMLGSATTAPIVVTNTGVVPLTITGSIVAGGNGLTVVGLPPAIAPGASDVITLRCAPSAVGHYTASVLLASNAENAPTTVGVGCRAATGRITVLEGRRLALGWCESATVTIQNTGVGPLKIDELRFTSEAMWTSGITLPTTLASNATASWQVNCVCWKPAFSITSTQFAKHDGVQEGPFGVVTCGIGFPGEGESPALAE